MTPNLRADKRNEEKITTILRRTIGADFQHYTEAWHPAFQPLALDFSMAASSSPQRVVGDFLSPTLSTRPPWVKKAIEGEGEWVFVLDAGMQSTSADALWMIQAVERPSSLMELIESQGVATDALVMQRQVKGLWLVAIQASILKDVIKKSHHINQ
jgi:hypothetical protein